MIIKLLLAAVLCLGIGNAWQFISMKWKASGYEARIAKLEQEKDTLRMENEKLLAERNYEQAKGKAKERVRYVERKTNEAVGSGDDAAMRRLFIERGMLKKDEAGPAGVGGAGGSKHKPAAPPRPAAVQ